jgi:hypothetical protein
MTSGQQWQAGFSPVDGGPAAIEIQGMIRVRGRCPAAWMGRIQSDLGDGGHIAARREDKRGAMPLQCQAGLSPVDGGPALAAVKRQGTIRVRGREDVPDSV